MAPLLHISFRKQVITGDVGNKQYPPIFLPNNNSKTRVMSELPLLSVNRASEVSL